MDVELQVISIFSLTNGQLDNVKLEDISRFEKDLHDFFKADKEGSKILEEIITTKGLPNPDKINDCINRFKEIFV